KKDYVTISDSFVAIYGKWIPNKAKILTVAIYASQQPMYRRVLWEYLSILLSHWNGHSGLDQRQKSQLSCSKQSILDDLRNIDKELDQGEVPDSSILRRHEVKCKLNDIKEMEATDSMQKSKVRWAIEGDENSKFFHEIINKKRSHLVIHGVFDEGMWIIDPNLVKKAFLDQYGARFKKPTTVGLKLNFPFPNRLSQVQVEDLERGVSHEEICSAVWDC
nr:RNA-directed DNA polymerase, eukaryota [Tanacetum cinerariifolium]